MTIFVLARFFGVKVEEVYVGFAPWFSLYKKTINNTVFCLGWLPLGGYTRLSGIELEEHEEILPHHFEHLSLPKQLAVMFGGPLSSLILGLIVYIYFNGTTLSGIGSVLVILILIMLGYVLLFKFTSSFIKKNIERSKVDELVRWILSMILFLGSLLTIAFFVNKVFPLKEIIDYILAGNLSYDFLFQEFSIENLKTYVSYTGVIFFFMNLLPFSGLIGMFVVNTIYRGLSGTKVSESLETIISIITLPILLFIWGWIFYHFIW